MTSEEIQRQCGRICPVRADNQHTECGFSFGDIIAFLDTSAKSDGSRGIAFFAEKMAINIGGSVCEVQYKDIRSVEILPSFESGFSDELIISGCVSRYVSGGSFEYRISDYSLDKPELKKLIDSFCESADKAEAYPEDFYDEFSFESGEEVQSPAPLAESSIISEQNVEDNEKEEFGGLAESEIREEDSVAIPEYDDITDNILGELDFEEKAVGEIPENVISEHDSDVSGVVTNSGENTDNAENNADISERDNITEKAEEKPIIPAITSENAEFKAVRILPPNSGEKPPENEEIAENNAIQSDNEDFDEQAELERISNMSHEQTVSYLADAFAEINGELPCDNNAFSDNESDKPTPDDNVQNQPEKLCEPDCKNTERLTVEPIWGDIYIKASRSLRQLCEEGKLSMAQIETELSERLLDSAKVFAEISADETKIPQALMPKISELRNAAKNSEKYFEYGEDIGTRAMFFMLYQMLSYADRIVESDEIKENLNDFFRRFGAAGITLSMLDMRVN